MKVEKLNLTKNGTFELKSENILEEKNKDLVKVTPLKVGICSSDIPRAFDKKAYFYPLVLGHEFCVSVLEDKENHFHPGQLCTVFPLIPCFRCNSCKKQNYNTCSDYSYYGSRIDGGLQSSMYIKRWNLIPLPDEIDLYSASLIEPIAVCVHSAKKIKSKKNILLYGGGFLSQIMSKLLLNKGCKITCIDRNEYKKKFFHNDVNFITKDENLTNSNYDFAVECCGAKNILSKCINALKNKGTIIQLANPSREVNLNYELISKLMRKELNIVGTWNSDFRPDNKNLCDWHKAISLLKNKSINVRNLISHEQSISQAPELLNKINNRKRDISDILDFNKAVINIKQ